MTPYSCRIVRSASVASRTVRATAIILALGWFVLSAGAATLIYQEGFNTDGETDVPTRYTTTGRDVYEVPRIRNELMNADQKGPIYWAHNFEVTFVGIPEIPARRMIFAWNGVNDASTASEDFFNLLLSSVKWMVKDKANAVIVVFPDATAIGILADRLRIAGYTVNDDDPSVLDDSQMPGDLFIHAIGANPSRFALVAKPVIAMNAPDWDDMIVGSIGTTLTFAPGSVEIAAPAHPAAGGKTGTFPLATGDFSFHLPGRFLPGGATTLATVEHTIPPAVTRLADVDQMIAGTKPAIKSTNQVVGLDFSDASPGNWFDDNPMPGGETGNWGLHARGKLNVGTAGTYSVAIGSDDGARLQIDVDKNGFSVLDTIIEDLGPHGHLIQYGDVTFPATGVYDFQIISYNSGGSGSLEFSVANIAGAGTRSALDSGEWDLVGTSTPTSPVTAQGPIDVNGFVATGASTVVKEPLIVLLNGPDDTPRGFFYGGGPFEGFEGTGFFAASGINKWDTLTGGYPNNQGYRSLQLKPVDVTGRQNVKLNVALAGAQIDFEAAGDFLDILAYTNGVGGTPVRLAHFRGVETGVQPWLADELEGFTRRLTRQFADFQYDIPTNATQLVIEFRAGATWWNEILAFDNVRITEGAIAAVPQITNITKSGNSVTITWINGGTLEWTAALSPTSVTTQWTSTGDTDGSYNETVAGTKFFRVRQ